MQNEKGLKGPTAWGSFLTLPNSRASLTSVVQGKVEEEKHSLGSLSYELFEGTISAL